MSLAIDVAVPARGLAARLTVEAGETLAILGPNGSGKSTLLAAVAGTLRPTSGSVRWGGVTLSDAGGSLPVWVPPHRRRIALLAQDPALFPHLDVRDNVAFGPRSNGRSRREARAGAMEWLERVGAAALAARRPGTLSGGQAQRVALARALAAEPEVLLLDEPFAALDVEAAPALRRVLSEVLAPVTTMLVTHELLDAVALADTVAVLEAGAVAETGPAAELLARPQTPAAARAAGLNLLTENGLRKAFRPSAVRLSRTPEPGARAARIDALEPHGDYVRVRCGELLADLAPAEAGAVAPGDEVWLSVPPQGVQSYPARGITASASP